MSLTTFSRFYYGHIVTAENNTVDFDEGGSEITAFLDVGSYTLTDYLNHVAAMMTEYGGQTYSASVNRTTRIATISATSNFTLRTASGSTLGTTAFTMMGYTGADRTGTNTYAADSASGSEYSPQFILQDHVASENGREAVEASVNVSASGQVEVVSFGTARFVQMNIMYITDIAQNGAIMNNASGVADARAFMEYATQKAPVEYMPSVSALSTFQDLLLESTPQSSKGTAYRLKELYDTGLPGYFETGVLKWRVLT
jgi:hypothetical protein